VLLSQQKEQFRLLQEIKRLRTLNHHQQKLSVAALLAPTARPVWFFNDLETWVLKANR
jgi:hypothetical protein